MRTASIPIRLGLFQLLFAGLTAGGQGLAEMRVAIADNGWHSWRVAAHAGAGEWCCTRWSMGQPARTACDLDSRSDGINITHTEVYRAGEMQIYALLDKGKPIDLRTLSPRCAIRTDRAIKDLGPIATDISLDWLQAHVEPRSDISSYVLAAISVHEGTRSRDTLIRIARDGANIEDRMDAIQWLGVVRIGETTDVIRQLVFEKGNGEIQEQAIHALSQLPPDEAARELIAVIEKPDLAMEIRRMALFSLANTDSDLVISYISGLLAVD